MATAASTPWAAGSATAVGFAEPLACGIRTWQSQVRPAANVANQGGPHFLVGVDQDASECEALAIRLSEVEAECLSIETSLRATAPIQPEEPAIQLRAWLRRRFADVETELKALTFDGEGITHRIHAARNSHLGDLERKERQAEECRTSLEECRSMDARLRVVYEQRLGQAAYDLQVLQHNMQQNSTATEGFRLEADSLELRWRVDQAAMLKELEGLSRQLYATRSDMVTLRLEEEELQTNMEGIRQAIEMANARLTVLGPAAASASFAARSAEANLARRTLPRA